MKQYTALFLLLFSLSAFSKASLQLTTINLENSSSKNANLNNAKLNNDFLQVVVRFKNEKLPESGTQSFQFESYLGDGLYLIALAQNAISNKTILAGFSEMYTIEDVSKIDQTILQSETSIPTTVLFSSVVSLDQLQGLASQLGFQLENIDIQHRHFNAYLTSQQIQNLSHYQDIFYITKYYPIKHPLMIDNAQMIGQNQINGNVPFGFNLDGSGNNIGIWDEGIADYNIDLPKSNNVNIDKELDYYPYTLHPMYVAGCIGAQGNNYPTYKAISTKSTNYYWDILNDILGEMSTAKTSYNVNISNHSYNFGSTTCYESGSYIPEAADLDKLVYSNPEMLPVIAVGNSASFCAISDTFHSVDIGFQGCKNVITVGWLFADKKIVGNSGRGPVDDGRLKPELVAKGFAVTTTGPGNNYATGWGSSFAAPFVTGCVSVLYQKYKQQNGIFPNASLIKATLCNTAKDLGNEGPDYTFGFGHPDILKAVQTIANNQNFESSVTTGQTTIYSIVVPANSTIVKATLCWTDKEGSPLANKYLVNDLDLKLVSPAGDTILPWILNPSNPNSNATHGIDKLNNIEFASLKNPVAGNYKLVVKGTNVPFGPQSFSLVYYTQPKEMEITFPNGGELLDTRSTYNIRWNANGIDSIGIVEYSFDNGLTWNLINSSVPTKNEIASWTIPNNVYSNQCLVRITSGLHVAVSVANFTIGGQLDYNTIQHSVCDGNVKITWSPQTGATAYKVYLFDNEKWNLVGQTSNTNFIISNLTNGKKYLYAISTIINGIEGNHSLAKTFTPTATACATLNDVGVYEMYEKLGGRKFTSTALSSTEKLSFIVKNFGTTTQNSVAVKYTINGGAVRSAILNQSMPTTDTAIILFTTIENLSSVGNYQILAWTELPGDENKLNDTLHYTFKHLANVPMSLPFYDSFESSNANYSKPIFGIDSLEYQDFYREYNGRWRSEESNLTANTGLHAITLDNIGNSTAQKTIWIHTYNLSNYIDSVLFFDFHFMNRAEKDAGDKIYARGNDLQPWIEIYDLYANRGDSGVYHNIEGINLYQKLKIENNQAFSSSTQLKFEVACKSPANTPYDNGGYTFDDIKLYSVGKDVAVLDANIKALQCTSVQEPQPITATIKNNSGNAITNLNVFYQVDNNTPVHEIVSTTINNTQVFAYTFTTTFNNLNPGNYTIKVWAENAGDYFHRNDTVIVTTKVMQTINSYPYYNGFENDNGNVIPEGVNTSWVWGTPQKLNMNNAAEDNKAWTTGLTKGNNYRENSTLLLGCFNFSNLSSDPLIAFHFFKALQAQSDSAFMEYSTDNSTWKRLGCNSCGLNWYDGGHQRPYWENNLFPWQTAHVSLPLNSLTDSATVLLRFHLISDEFYTTEGIGIDDIHILTDYKNIANEDSTYVYGVSTGAGWVSFYKNGDIIAELNDDGKALGVIKLGFEANTLKHKSFNGKNFLSRNWVITAQNNLIGDFKLRFYVQNFEYTNFVLSEDSINRMGDIGMLRYIGLNTNLDIIDNYIRNYYKYFAPQEVHFYPYNGGYYVELNTDTLGEFYLMSSKGDLDAAQKINLTSFDAEPLNNDVYMEWTTSSEISSQYFIIQYSFDGVNFINVDTVPAGVNSTNSVLYNYIHELNSTGGSYYYRVVGVDLQMNKYYSLIDTVYFAPVTGVKQISTSITSFINEENIFIQLKNLNIDNANVVVYNVKGQVLVKQKQSLHSGVQSLNIPDFKSWAPAVYLIQIQSNEHQYYSKLVKGK